MSWIVVRYPCLPEDEGRTHLLTSVESEDEAEAYVKDYIKDGYFSRGDLGVIEVKPHMKGTTIKEAAPLVSFRMSENIHGLRFYAVDSQDVGTFGGRVPRATIKIYRSNNANVPACVLDQTGQMEEFKGLIEDCGDDRNARDRVMNDFVKFGG